MNRVPGQLEHRVIEGEVISVRYEEIPLQDVTLDAENSRIRHIVSQHKHANKSLSIDELRKIIWELPGSNCQLLWIATGMIRRLASARFPLVAY